MSTERRNYERLLIDQWMLSEAWLRFTVFA